MVTAMALAPAPSPIAVLGTAWTWNLGAPSQTSPPCRLVSLHIASTGLGGGQVAQCPDPARDVGCEENQVPCPRAGLCCS